MRIEIDRDICIGAASCEVIASKTFKLDNERKAIVINPNGDDAATIMEAAKSCPVLAIYLYGEDGKQIFPEPPKNSSGVSVQGRE
ncbi:MAG: ferredoxin [Parcubacteria group bacterium]|nr:ferredoxin [Parcubacteria group bacterium]